MTNIYGAPEITVQEVARLRVEGEPPILLDVREEMELRLANLGDEVVWVPLSKMADERLASLPPELADKNVGAVVFCHTGVRSAQVTAWMLSEGWSNIVSMAGGIEAYALQIDPTVGRY
jgi:rhodanese-related sulfurtransferase